MYSEYKGHISYGDPVQTGSSKVGPDKLGNPDILRSHFISKEKFKDIVANGES